MAGLTKSSYDLTWIDASIFELALIHSHSAPPARMYIAIVDRLLWRQRVLAFLSLLGLLRLLVESSLSLFIESVVFSPKLALPILALTTAPSDPYASQSLSCPDHFSYSRQLHVQLSCRQNAVVKVHLVIKLQACLHGVVGLEL